ncbi:MAG: hypothetical protein ACOZCP_19325 [Pseudomonadota bacterium]|jgi:hypothetical protein
MSNIKSRVMLAMLNISVWDAHVHDSKATSEVEKNHSTSDIGRFNKRLLPKKAASFEAVMELARTARETFYRYTLKYGQDGVRLLPAEAYMELAQEIRGLKVEFPRRVEAFLEDLPNLKAVQKAALNGLYREDDYPTVDVLRTKFDLRFKVLPFPDAEQFGVTLPEADLIEIRKSIDEHTAEAAQIATRDLWNRMYEAVSRMTVQLSKPSGRIHDSLVENVREIVELLPSLNFTGDSKLAELCEQAAAKLASQDAEELRQSMGTRMTVAQQAADIQAQMAAYMGIELPENFGQIGSAAAPEGALL